MLARPVDRSPHPPTNQLTSYTPTHKTSPQHTTQYQGPWCPEEDALLESLVEKLGPKPKKWSLIASHIPGRAGKQCRER